MGREIDVAALVRNTAALLDLLTEKKPASAAELASWTRQRPNPYVQPKEHIAIKLDPQVYDAYAGHYVLAPNSKLSGTITLTIQRQGGALFRQVPGWFAQQIFPESETTFFNATEDEQLTFVKNNQGEVTGLVVEEGGTFGESGRRELDREK